MWLHKRYRCITAVLLLPAALMLSGCGSEPAAPPAARPPEVAVVMTAAERVVLTTELPGRISAHLVAEIRPQVNGLLQKRLFEEGTLIKEGDLLYQIDPAPYQAAYDQAVAALAMSEADVVLAESNLPAMRSRVERMKGLAAINAVGQQDYDDAVAALKQAEANLAVRKTAVEVNRAAIETAKINLSYTPIKAPISGRIGRSAITVGAMVTAYQPAPLAVIQQLDPVYVDVTQASAELLRLTRSLEDGNFARGSETRSTVKLLLEDGTDYPLTGRLQFRDVSVDPTTGSVTLRMLFANPKQVLLPGMFVRAVVEEGVNEHAIFISQQGVLRDTRGNPYVFVLDGDSRAEQRPVALDRAIGSQWLVSGGLEPGERVIVEGVQNVRHGVTVTAVPFEERGTDVQQSADSK